MGKNKKYVKIEKIYKKFFKKLDYYKKSMQGEILSKKKVEKLFSYDFVDMEGSSPLHLACMNNRVTCAKLLLYDYGCSINISNQSGFRPRELI